MEESKRTDGLFGYLALGLLVAGLLVPFIIGAFADGELAMGFGVVAVLLALVFGIIGWKRKAGKVTVITVGCLGALSIITFTLYSRVRETSEHERAARARQAVTQIAKASSADGLNPVTLHATPDHAPVVLVEKSVPKAVVVVTCENTRLLQAAVGDLTHYIRRTTGAELPRLEARAGDGPAIVVGVQPASDTSKPGSFTIKTAANTVEITGNDANGAAWGIYEFLERFVGVRWYWPEYKNDVSDCGTSIIATQTLTVPPIHLSDAPVFRKRVRWPSGGPRIGAARMTDHDRRLRCANSWPVELIVHAPHNWAAIYRESRPEIFQLRKDGGRDYSMLCYGHPKTLQTYLEEIELQLAAKAGASRGRSIIKGKAITVSPADMAVSCRCRHCRKLWNDGGSQYASASRVLGTFVAKLGREVKERWPDMTVIFLPYKNYTYAPKGIKFPDNVEIQICGMPGMAMYKDAEINKSEQANIDAWIRLTGRKIQNWHYSCWPANRTEAAYLFPHTVQAHYRANRDKTVGTFINGVADHWPRQHLSLYVWLKVLWDPDINVDAVIDEYCRRMYGPAAATMRELVGMLVSRWEDSEWEPHVLSPKTVYEQSYPRELVLKIEALLDRAIEEAADDALASARLAYYEPPLRAFFAESKLLTEGKGIKPLNVYQVAEDPTIDGKLDDKAWQKIKPVHFVKVGKKPSKPEFPTALKVVWTRRGITFGFRLTEPEMAKLKHDIAKESRDASLIWWNDNVEVFVDPSGERRGYYQFIVNPNGAIWDSIGRENTGWNPPGVKAAGYLGKGFWSVELFVPYDSFDKPRLPGTGTVWHGNFTRHRVTDRKHREYQGYNVTTGAPSHNQNAFGPFRFIER